MNLEVFKNELEKLNINVNDTQLKQLEDYYNLLIEWNNKINLTAITEKEQVYLKHFYDSLTLSKVIDLKNEESLCDIGTGAGFPGLVLKIVFPNLKVTLVDSLNKRITFLNEVIKELELKDIETVHARAEEFAHDNIEKFDIVTSRAVANIEKLLKYTMHLLNKDGLMIAMKGDIEKELTSEVKRKIELKYQIDRIHKFKLPIENSKRCLLIIKNKR